MKPIFVALDSPPGSIDGLAQTRLIDAVSLVGGTSVAFVGITSRVGRGSVAEFSMEEAGAERLALGSQLMSSRMGFLVEVFRSESEAMKARFTETVGDNGQVVVSCGAVEREGYVSIMQKRDGVKSWKRAYLVLSHGSLRVYKAPDSTSPILSLSTRGCSVATIPPPVGESRPELTIRATGGGGKVLRVRCEGGDGVELGSWREAVLGCDGAFEEPSPERVEGVSSKAKNKGKVDEETSEMISKGVAKAVQPLLEVTNSLAESQRLVSQQMLLLQQQMDKNQASAAARPDSMTEISPEEQAAAADWEVQQQLQQKQYINGRRSATPPWERPKSPANNRREEGSKNGSRPISPLGTMEERGGDWREEFREMSQEMDWDQGYGEWCWWHEDLRAKVQSDDFHAHQSVVPPVPPPSILPPNPGCTRHALSITHIPGSTSLMNQSYINIDVTFSQVVNVLLPSFRSFPSFQETKKAVMSVARELGEPERMPDLRDLHEKGFSREASAVAFTYGGVRQVAHQLGLRPPLPPAPNMGFATLSEVERMLRIIVKSRKGQQRGAKHMPSRGEVVRSGFSSVDRAIRGSHGGYDKVAGELNMEPPPKSPLKKKQVGP